MLDFFTKFFKPERSGATAKERLRLVLLSDHLSLAPDVVESLKRDLIEVISRYCEVDVANTDVSFEQQDSAVAMLANIPILGLRNGRSAPPASPSPPPPYEPPSSATPAHAALAHVPQAAADTALVTPSFVPDATTDSATTAVALPIEPAKPKASRKRRRRPPNVTQQQAPAT